MNRKYLPFAPELRGSITRLIAWADRYEPEFNENIASDEPVPDDFALGDVFAPGDLTVGDLRRLREVCRYLLQS
jgi:hypothetical protein